MNATRRQEAYNFLLQTGVASLVARDVESLCHASSCVTTDYDNRIVRAAHNLSRNPGLGARVVVDSDETCALGTAVGRVHEEARLKRERFQQMLQEKYDALNDQKFATIVRCRRCRSEDIMWEEKQVRSADEGATIFAACTNCKHRWVMAS